MNGAARRRDNSKQKINRDMILKPESYMKKMSTIELIDAIHNQQEVVADCAENAQHKASITTDEAPHSCNGLFYATRRLNQLTNELINRMQTSMRKGQNNE